MKITIKHILLGLMFTASSLMAQLVVSAEDFARNPSRYNGRQIVIRNVPISKNSGRIQLNGPRALSGTSPTASSVSSSSSTAVVPSGNTPQSVSINPSSGPGNTNTAPAPTTVTTRVNTCTPPRNWEKINVNIPNYDGCFVMYSRMARTIVANRQVNADITFLVDTRLMHRITRVKINP
jgi:hypothetical protein